MDEKLKKRLENIEGKLGELVDTIEELSDDYGYAGVDELESLNERVDAVLMLVKELKKDVE